MPINLRHLDVHCWLTCLRHSLQSKGHMREIEEAMMRCETGCVTIFFANIDVSIYAVHVYCQKYRRISKPNDIFVHALILVRIPDRDCVQLAVLDANTKGHVCPRHVVDQ